ncbi:MBL fold metallo-hydrolase [Kibdelosporangium phytohabitans]|uniref:MBL fold metallo-hydrolase n=1 Tax=Kibdelosporangium phytohabitans TaxID=860235 RepID=A0A0N9IDJ7_9PSEU|nr:MBL fold metallo-hydrolase [Kibdelosporangium phytohabitans]ALG14525.1 MBL fold metallo-hydrolase [Kibdelosporangium phytohabitans]MBE1465837.1 glyoxylase-like metal-dependent hydrolase (beta-lactamase superfamily II) [Kibdelosporangium phytohabitans]
MRVHHLNCGTMRPLGGKLLDGQPGHLRRGTMICHCLLIETDDGLVLVDTGIGSDDIRDPKTSLTKEFLLAANPILDARETAAQQVVGLGYKIEDVRHIIPTHLDLDHAGGLRDFPDATVHVYAEELQVAQAQATAKDRSRFRKVQWAHARFESYQTSGEDWFGFEAVRDLKGLPSEILIVPLRGHTAGHAGVAVDIGDKWLLHGGDSYFFHGEMDPAHPHCPPLLTLFQKIVETERAPRLRNQDRLRDLARDQSGRVELFCAHDPAELARYR